MRYLFAGGLSSAIYYATFTAGWLAFGDWTPYLLVAVATNAFTAVVTYPVYRCVVFRADGPWLAGLARFYVVCLWALAFVLGGLALLVEIVGLHVLLAQAIVIVIGPVINYQAGRLWAFRSREVRHAD
ncbi:GtrA family protein [Pilimelia columellifera]|uniref:GtrA/DPMS transmembrane domain-containing protein n=1 Tax=Pilimelia columellifera subsp. columellifera TaxID=706583 RepID=A0ABP6AZD1_9ACTN